MLTFHGYFIAQAVASAPWHSNYIYVRPQHMHTVTHCQHTVMGGYIHIHSISAYNGYLTLRQWCTQWHISYVRLYTVTHHQHTVMWHFTQWSTQLYAVTHRQHTVICDIIHSDTLYHMVMWHYTQWHTHLCENIHSDDIIIVICLSTNSYPKI